MDTTNWYCDYCKEVHYTGQTCSKPVFNAFDVVMLENHTSAYRAYSLPSDKFLFVCLYADEIRHSDDVIVSKKIDDPLNTERLEISRPGTVYP